MKKWKTGDSFFYFGEKEIPQPHAVAKSFSGVNINLLSNIFLL